MCLKNPWDKAAECVERSLCLQRRLLLRLQGSAQNSMGTSVTTTAADINPGMSAPRNSARRTRVEQTEKISEFPTDTTAVAAEDPQLK